MIHLNYKTNKELVKEMLRILPGFELERQSILLSNTEELHSYFSDFLSEQNTEEEDYCSTVTPSDVIRFLQDERVMLNYRETSDNQYRTSNTATIFELVINRSIFLSSENFQRGVEELLLPELKKIK